MPFNERICCWKSEKEHLYSSCLQWLACQSNFFDNRKHKKVNLLVTLIFICVWKSDLIEGLDYELFSDSRFLIKARIAKCISRNCFFSIFHCVRRYLFKLTKFSHVTQWLETRSCITMAEYLIMYHESWKPSHGWKPGHALRWIKTRSCKAFAEILQKLKNFARSNIFYLQK